MTARPGTGPFAGSWGEPCASRCDFPEALRAPLIQRLGEIIRNPNAENREVLAAAGTLPAFTKECGGPKVSDSQPGTGNIV